MTVHTLMSRSAVMHTSQPHIYKPFATSPVLCKAAMFSSMAAVPALLSQLVQSTTRDIGPLSVKSCQHILRATNCPTRHVGDSIHTPCTLSGNACLRPPSPVELCTSGILAQST